MTKNVTILSPEFRLSYPNVFKSKFNDLSKKEEFSITMLIPKDSPDLAALVNAVQSVTTARWGANPPVFKNTLFKDGDGPAGKNKDGTPKLGCAGHWIVTAKAQGIVGVWNQATNSYLTDPNQLYGGCYCRAQINVFTYPKQGEKEVNPGVAIQYTAIMKARDGEPFGAGPVDAAKVFADIASLPASGAPAVAPAASPVVPVAAAVPAGAVQATPAALAAFFG